MKTTRQVLRHHLEALENQDLEAIMEDYTDGSVIITNTGTCHGLDQIADLYGQLFNEASGSGVEIEIDRQEIEGEIAFIAWHGETPNTRYRFAIDTFLVQEGAIVAQTAGIDTKSKTEG